MPTGTPLSSFMRRMLTGYAVSFNRRHQRSGHLFQNRYKSIVCEEEPYLLELLRYIHLNPLRAGMVKTLDELDRYPWSGHAVLMGNRSFPGQETDSVLKRFGNKPATAMVRGVIYHLAIFEFGYSGGEVGRFLHLGSSGVSLAARRGERHVKAEPAILKQILDAIEK